jgi:hypothetical protein
VCDVAYVLLADQVETRVLADRQIAAVLIAAGARDVEIPDPDDARDRLDALLVAEPKRPDPEQLELARALGVA